MTHPTPSDMLAMVDRLRERRPRDNSADDWLYAKVANMIEDLAQPAAATTEKLVARLLDQAALSMLGDDTRSLLRQAAEIIRARPAPLNTDNSQFTDRSDSDGVYRTRPRNLYAQPAPLSVPAEPFETTAKERLAWSRRYEPERFLSRLLRDFDRAMIAAAPDSQTGSQWRTIETAPKDRWLITWREGEKHTSIASKREWPDGEAEWISGDGSTTITHHSYAPPTHYLMPPPAPDIRSEDAQDKWREFCKGCPHPGYCAGKRECYYGKPAGLESQTETKEEEA